MISHSYILIFNVMGLFVSYVKSGTHVNDSVLLANTGRTFIKRLCINYKKVLGKNIKLNKHKNYVSHIRSVEQERLTLEASKNYIYS